MAAPRNNEIPDEGTEVSPSPHFPQLLPPPPFSDSIGVSLNDSFLWHVKQQQQQEVEKIDTSNFTSSMNLVLDLSEFPDWCREQEVEQGSTLDDQEVGNGSEGKIKDNSSGSVEDRKEFPKDFSSYLRRKLYWSRLEPEGGDSHVNGWVFWNREDDRPKTLPVSDFENVDVFPNSSPKVKDKIRLALGRIILHPRYGQSLVQFWAPSRTWQGRTLLTTRNEPFGLGKAGKSAWGLCDYRMKSMNYTFYGDIGEKGEEELGLPGRVFLYKLPESASDVQYYSREEYPQLLDASLCQVRASWALPVFKHSSQVCVGVLELVSAVDTIADWYDKSFLRNLYDVFQELDLQLSDVNKHYEMKDEDKALTTAFHELAMVLESVCEIHKLPLALTWVPCNACDALLPGRLSSNGGEYLRSFKANDNHLVESLIASTGYHLRKGQAFSEMVYCSDITQLSIAEYPLVLVARQCEFRGWFRIRLRSSYTGADVYILEFFLPTSSKDNENILTTLSTILRTIMANSKTFKLGSGEELGEKLSVQICDFQNGQRHQYYLEIQVGPELLNIGNDGMDVINAEQENTVATISKGGTTKTQEREHKKTGVSFDISLENVLQFSALSRKDAAMRLKVSESTLKRVCRKHGIHRWPPRDLNQEVFPMASPNVEDIGRFDLLEELEVDATKYGSDDNERLVPIEKLQQHFGCKREDVARSLGVSVSTLKRMCREHGIKRWPYRQNGEELLDPDQPSMDAVNNGRSSIGVKRSNLDVTFSEEGSITMQERKMGKTGVRIEIPLEAVLQYSNLRLDDAAKKLKVSSTTLKHVCRDYGIYRWPPRIIDDETFSEGSITQERKKGKTGVRIEIPLEFVLQYSNLRLDDAARELKVSSSTLKRVCRQYGIHRWPPRNIDDVGAPQPSHDVPPRNLDKVGALQPPLVELQEGISELSSDRPLASESRDYRIPLGLPPNINKVGAPGPSHFEHQDGSSQLTSDMPSNQAPLREEGILQLTLDRPSNQVLDDVTHVKPRDTAVQDTKMVTIRAKYVNVTLKFQLPLRSRLEELHRQVGKRLNLKPEAYDIKYEDDDGELILMACDDDLTECINTSRSRSSSKNSIVVVLEPKQLM